MKKTVNAGILYSNFITAALCLLAIAGIICVSVLTPNEERLWKGIWVGVLSVAAAVGFISFLLLFQTATLSEHGIAFRCASSRLPRCPGMKLSRSK